MRTRSISDHFPARYSPSLSSNLGIRNPSIAGRWIDCTSLQWSNLRQIAFSPWMNTKLTSRVD